MKLDIKYFLDELEKMFPNADIELDFSNPFQLLVAVLLSAQATDKQVNKVTEKFFQKIKTPYDIVNLVKNQGLIGLENEIKSIGLYKNKAKNLYLLSEKLINWVEEIRNGKKTIKDFCETKKCINIFNKYLYIIPDKIKVLVSLPGVGIKTAKVVLNVLYGLDYIPVDTHIHRITNRLGIVSTKTPEQTSKELEKIIPSDYKKRAHHYLIFFGRYFCKAKNPNCKDCKFKKYCSFYKKLPG